MLRAARIYAQPLLFVAVVAICLRAPPPAPAFGADHLPTLSSRALTEGYSLAAAISPDGRSVATLLSLPPGTPILLPQVLTLQIWDAITLRLVQSREISVSQSSAQSGTITGNVTPPYDCFIRYSSDGAFLVYSDVEANLHVLDTHSLRDIRSITLNLPEYQRPHGLVSLEVSPDGKLLAVALSESGFAQNLRDVEVRVLTIDAGRLLWKANLEANNVGGIAWSPDGRGIALTLLAGTAPGPAQRPDPTRENDSALVLDSSSGRVLSRFNTGDVAGPICFGPNQEVFTAPARSLHKDGTHESVKVWDAQTGILKRKISYQGRDVYEMLGLSKDGRVLMGYIGKQGSKLDLLDMTRYSAVLDQRFAIWDARNGRLLADSPNLMPSKASKALGPTSALNIELSAAGGAVLVSWRAAMAKPIVFDVPEVPEQH